MSNVKNMPISKICDKDIFNDGRNAKNKKDRRLALDICLDGMWATADIGRLERVDTESWHGWKMWRWKKE